MRNFWRNVTLILACATAGAIGASLVTPVPGQDIQARLVKGVHKALPSVVAFHLKKELLSEGDTLFERLSSLFAQEKFSYASGVAIRQGGFILTNAHVVTDFKSYYATTYNGRILTARTVASEPELDIAVVKVDEDLPAIELCQFDKVEPGQFVFSVGTPYRLPFSVSFGIISALHRDRLGFPEVVVEDYIQTDADINPGSSGGPLCDLDGRLVGMNTAQFSLRTGSNGINFAVPASLIVQLIDKMIAGKPAARAYLGAHLGPLDFRSAALAGLDSVRGCVVLETYADSPARKAGLVPGDIVISADGSPVISPFSLVALAYVKSPGDKVMLELQRAGKRMSIVVTLGAVDVGDPPRMSLPELGATVEKPDAETLARLRVKYGAIVDFVDPEGVAMKLGIKSGDVIVAVGGTTFNTLAELAAAVADSAVKGEVRVRFISASTGVETENSLKLK
ncbi:MAG: trypsin-like peptidase domain-containing protein [Candidatus Brocadiia bacterium]